LATQNFGSLLKDAVYVFDEKYPVVIFPNPKFSSNFIFNIECLLENNDKYKRGLALKEMDANRFQGVWVGEYNRRKYNRVKILRSELVFGFSIESAIKSLGENSTEKLNIKYLKRALKSRLRSKVVMNFRYLGCQEERKSWCLNRILKQYDKTSGEINYLELGDMISKLLKCKDVLLCPLRKANSMDRVYNFAEMLSMNSDKKVEFVSGSYKLYITNKG
jgi:hypothetical protein